MKVIRKNEGTFYVLLSALCFSLAGVLIKSIPWGSMAISGARSALALLVLLFYMRIRKQKMKWNRAVLFGAVCNYLMSNTFVFATKMTTAANAIVLQFTEPIFVIFAMWFFFGKKPEKSAILTAAVVFSGILCFFFEKLSPEGMAGNLLAIFSGICYTGVFLIKQIPGNDFESSLVYSYMISVAVGIPFLARETDFQAPVLLCVLLLGVVQYGFSYVFLSLGLDRVSPVTASLTSTIEPILNPLIVSLVTGETIGIYAVIGSILVIGASAVYNISDAKKKTEKVQDCP